ncbi:hypothetical protein BD777DRAFT_130396 [Yarrowia lipolytica]|nr:hypothetical protein BD777DRAFT_130396 [Yarrowia lipolytica]
MVGSCSSSQSSNSGGGNRNFCNRHVVTTTAGDCGGSSFGTRDDSCGGDRGKGDTLSCRGPIVDHRDMLLGLLPSSSLLGGVHLVHLVDGFVILRKSVRGRARSRKPIFNGIRITPGGKDTQNIVPIWGVTEIRIDVVGKVLLLLEILQNKRVSEVSGVTLDLLAVNFWRDVFLTVGVSNLLSSGHKLFDQIISILSQYTRWNVLTDVFVTGDGSMYRGGEQS